MPGSGSSAPGCWLGRRRPPPPPPPAPGPGGGVVGEGGAPAAPAAPRSRTEAWASVRGKVTWGKPEPPREAFLVVQGLDKDGPRSHARVPFGKSYQFDRLPARAYHLIGGGKKGGGGG